MGSLHCGYLWPARPNSVSVRQQDWVNAFPGVPMGVFRAGQSGSLPRPGG